MYVEGCRWRGGLGGDGAEWDKQSAVNSSAVEQKFSTNLLDELFSMAVEEGRSRRCLRILFRSSILYRRVWVRLILAASCAVPKDGEGFLDVPWHGEVDFPSLVVPLNYESAVSLAFPVTGAFEKYFRTVPNKCWAFSSPTYLTLKSSATREKLIGRVSCCHRPGVVLLWW